MIFMFNFSSLNRKRSSKLGGGLIGYVKSKPFENGQIISIDDLVIVVIIAVFHKKLIWPPVRALSKLKRHLLDLTLWTTVLRATTTIDRWRHICFHLRFLSFESGFDIAIEKCCWKERDFVVGKSQARSKKTKTKRAFPILDSCLQVQFPRIKDVYSRTKTTYKVVLAAVFYLTATNLPFASFDIST